MRLGARTGVAILALVAIATGCRADAEEDVAVAEHADTVEAIQICVDWQSNPFAWCQVTQDLATVLTQARQRPGRDAATERMFARFPPKIEESPMTMRAWFEQTGRVIDYLKTSKQPLAMRERSLDFMRQQKKMMTDLNTGLANQRKAAIAAVIAELRPKVEAAIAPEKQEAARELGDARLAMADAKVAIDRTRVELERLKPLYTEMTTQFRALKGTEPGVTTELGAISTAGSAADIDGLPAVELRLRSFVETELARVALFGVEAARLRAEIGVARETYELLIEPHRRPFVGRDVLFPEVAADAARSLGNMTAYCQLRRDTFAASATRLIDGMRARRQALVSQKVAVATRDTIAQSALLKASQQFLDQATAHAAAEARVPPRSARLALPLFSDKYDQLQQILQLEPACTAAVAATESWMQAGCGSLAVTFGKARGFVNTTVPTTIGFTIPTLRRNNVAAALVTEIETHLAAGRTRQAIASYDAAVRATEVTP